MEDAEQDDQWERLVEEGRKWAGAEDEVRWRLGDLAVKLTKRYARDEAHSLLQYARAIGREYDTLKEYRRVAAAYENGMRIPNLSWEHHRAALSARKEERAEYLRVAAETPKLSAGKLRESIKDTKPKRLARAGITLKEQVDRIYKGIDLFCNYKTGGAEHVRQHIKELQDWLARLEMDEQAHEIAEEVLERNGVLEEVAA